MQQALRNVTEDDSCFEDVITCMDRMNDPMLSPEQRKEAYFNLQTICEWLDQK